MTCVSDKAEKDTVCVSLCVCVWCVLAQQHNNLKPQQMGIYAHM